MFFMRLSLDAQGCVKHLEREGFAHKSRSMASRFPPHSLHLLEPTVTMFTVVTHYARGLGGHFRLLWVHPDDSKETGSISRRIAPIEKIPIQAQEPPPCLPSDVLPTSRSFPARRPGSRFLT